MGKDHPECRPEPLVCHLETDDEGGHEYLGVKGELEVEGKKIGVYHGTDPDLLEGMRKLKK